MVSIKVTSVLPLIFEIIPWSTYDMKGKKDSIWFYYSPNGKIIKTEKYIADSLLKIDQKH